MLNLRLDFPALFFGSKLEKWNNLHVTIDEPKKIQGLSELLQKYIVQKNIRS